MSEHRHHPHGRPRRPTPEEYRRRRALVGTAAASVILLGIIAVAESGGGRQAVASSATTTTVAEADPTSSAAGVDDSVVADDATTLPADDTASTDPATTAGGASTQQDLDGGSDTTDKGGCTINRQSVRQGDSGDAVTCLQQALIANGYLDGSPSGTYDIKTVAAVKKLQTAKDLFVDGNVGRETALTLGIWPEEKLLVVRTPIPPKGAKDLLGYELSSVAVSGPDAPPLPDNSGTGKRLVYSRINQRVWAIDSKGRIVRSWLVSGSKYNNEIPGVHKVFSKSETSTAWNGKAILPHMVRYAKTKIGAIGFHGIPRHVSDGSRYQTDAELGTRLSGGCTRQADLDADFVWAFAEVGTTVVVL